MRRLHPAKSLGYCAIRILSRHIVNGSLREHPSQAHSGGRCDTLTGASSSCFFPGGPGRVSPRAHLAGPCRESCSRNVPYMGRDEDNSNNRISLYRGTHGEQVIRSKKYQKEHLSKTVGTVIPLRTLTPPSIPCSRSNPTSSSGSGPCSSSQTCRSFQAQTYCRAVLPSETCLSTDPARPSSGPP